MLRNYQRRMGLRLFLTVQIRLDCARDAELLTAMRDCGIRCLAVGIESPIDEELRAMGKRLSPTEMLELAKTYHRHGFLIHGMFIFFPNLFPQGPSGYRTGSPACALARDGTARAA